MDKDFYKKMAQALNTMDEAAKKKMDPVDQDELKGSHADRKDKDIDNDGDADKSDEYLHNRRKAVSKAIKGKDKAEVTMNTGTTGSKSGASMEQKEEAQLDELSKKTLGSYVKKASDDRAQNALEIGKTGKINFKGIKRRQGINRATDKLAKESALPPVYSRILEEREKHYKGAMKQQPMDDNLPGGGAKKMAADMKNGAEWDDTEEKGHKDVVKAGAPSAPVAKKRPNDRTEGDKSVINPVKGMK